MLSHRKKEAKEKYIEMISLHAARVTLHNEGICTHTHTHTHTPAHTLVGTPAAGLIYAAPFVRPAC